MTLVPITNALSLDVVYRTKPGVKQLQEFIIKGGFYMDTTNMIFFKYMCFSHTPSTYDIA